MWEFLRADDAELLPYDLEGTLIHARRLEAAGILSADELPAGRASGSRMITPADLERSDEDVHSAIERLLGDAGPQDPRRPLAQRPGRDRLPALRRRCLRRGRGGAAGFAEVVLERAEDEAETPMPGYTHLQRAIPVTLGHHLLAWVEMLERDRERLRVRRGAGRPSPLGAGALAGSTLPMPPPPEPMRNSIDAVADRDFALDYLYAGTVCFTHLSRIGEELVLWTTSEFGFAAPARGGGDRLVDDAAEAERRRRRARARQGGNGDRAADRPARDREGRCRSPTTATCRRTSRPSSRARADLRGALEALAVLVAGLRFDRERLAEACADPLLRATDAAEALVQEGMPFRDAHERGRRRRCARNASCRPQPRRRGSAM